MISIEERVNRIWARAGSRMDFEKAIKELIASELRATVMEAYEDAARIAENTIMSDGDHGTEIAVAIRARAQEVCK